MDRRLRYSARSNLSLLTGNPEHAFAASNALCFYPQNAIYTFIPKNACSSLRLTMAIENGCIESEAQFMWIHQNNYTFRAELRDLARASYTFVFLRCPFARLASAYLDKVVGREYSMWLLDVATDRRVEPHDLTFRNFVRLLTDPRGLKCDLHWRPQVDFLVYKNYDDYFRVEDMQSAARRLKRKLEVQLRDARPLTSHGTDRYRLLDDGCYADTAPHEIFAMQRSGSSPSHRALYDERLIETVAHLYAADIKLYKRRFGSDMLLFQEPTQSAAIASTAA